MGAPVKYDLYLRHPVPPAGGVLHAPVQQQLVKQLMSGRQRGKVGFQGHQVVATPTVMLRGLAAGNLQSFAAPTNAFRFIAWNLLHAVESSSPLLIYSFYSLSLWCTHLFI